MSLDELLSKKQNTYKWVIDANRNVQMYVYSRDNWTVQMQNGSIIQFSGGRTFEYAKQFFKDLVTKITAHPDADIDEL